MTRWTVRKYTEESPQRTDGEWEHRLRRMGLQVMVRYRQLPDYFFLDDRGSTRSLREYLGDFTVLAFTGRNRVLQRSLMEVLKSIVAENGGAKHVKVVVITVHSENRVGGRDGITHRVDVDGNLVTIDDAGGTIRRWHGVGREDEIHIIDPGLRVIDSASVQDAARLLQELRIDVAAFADRLHGGHPQESND